jgi:hypothetical protein
MEKEMRKVRSHRRRETGMRAALKAAGIVLTVGVLAMVAGQVAWRSGDGSVANPSHHQPVIAPDLKPVASL